MTHVINTVDNKPLTWSSDDRTANNVSNILRIWQGEAAFARPMGLSPSWSGAPAPTMRRRMASEIQEVLSEYEPDTKITDAQVLLDGQGRAVIEVTIDGE